MSPLRSYTAPNSGPFTLEGTRTFLIGRKRVAVLDPGPDAPPHLETLARAVEDAEPVVVLLTHGHADHAAGAATLAEQLRNRGAPPADVPILGAGDDARPLSDGDVVETDEGRLVSVETPGHARPHLSFHWPERDAVFVGDLVLGRGSTTWLGAYPGCVADWFRSLDRIESLDPSVLHPAHGPDIHDVAGALSRFREHRERRLDQLRRALDAEPNATPDELVRAVYGDRLAGRMLDATRRSVEAMLHHLRGPASP